MSLALHLRKVMHYLTSKGLGKFHMPQGNLHFVVIILMLKKYRCLWHSIAQMDSAPLPLLSLHLCLTRCRTAYLESHDAVRMPKEWPRSFSVRDAALLPLGSCGASVAAGTVLHGGRWAGYEWPQLTGCSKATPGHDTGPRLSGPVGTTEWLRMLGKGQRGHSAHTRFFRKPELISIPLRIRPAAWEQRYSKISKPFVWKRNFLSDWNCSQPSYCYCSLCHRPCPCPCPSLPGTSHPPGATLKKHAGHPRDSTHEQLVKCTRYTEDAGFFFALLNTEKKKNIKWTDKLAYNCNH